MSAKFTVTVMTTGTGHGAGQHRPLAAGPHEDLRVADRGGSGVGLSAIRESTIAIEHEEVRCAGGAERLGDLLALIVKSRGM